MTREQTQRFNDSVDVATNAIVAEFEWLLPNDIKKCSKAMVEINKSIVAIMKKINN